MKKSLPKISVCVVTYNQEKYIGKCLQSLVEQNCDFEFEVLVGDDASIDGTAKIITEFAERYPKIIIPIIRSKNIGACSNLINLYRSAKGQYIAHMDGDDFALPGKLQAQSDALDKNLSCVICSHDVIRIVGGKTFYKKSFLEEGFVVKDLMDLYQRLPFFAHSSKMFRNNFSAEFYNRFSEDTIDFEIHVEQAKCGNIIHLCEFFGGYLDGQGMTFSGGKLNVLLPAATRRVFNRVLEEDISDNNRSKLLSNYATAMLSYAYQSARCGSTSDCHTYAKESLSIKIVSMLQVAIYCASFIPLLSIVLARMHAYGVRLLAKKTL